MNQVQGATTGTHTIKYSVNYLSSVTNPKIIKNIPLQIVPKIDPTKLKRGGTHYLLLFIKTVNLLQMFL